MTPGYFSLEGYSLPIVLESPETQNQYEPEGREDWIEAMSSGNDMATLPHELTAAVVASTRRA